jgi:hypothetical protein
MSVMDNIEHPSDIIAEEAELDKPALPLHVRQCLALTDNSIQEYPNVRCFYAIDGKVFQGILLAETDDSFLVGASVKLLLTETKTVTIEPVSSSGVIRVLKSSLNYVTQSSGKSKYYYYQYLFQHGNDYLPDYLTKEVMDEITDFINNFKFENNLDLPPNTKRRYQGLDIPGASEYSFASIKESREVH